MSKTFWIILLVLAAIAFGLLMPLHTDFRAFYHAAQAIRQGDNLYAVEGFYSPAWVAVLYLPYTLFTYAVAVKLHAMIAFVIYGLAIAKLAGQSARPKLLALCLLPFAFYSLLWGNIEYLVMVAVFMPAPIGLLFVLAKPQIGFIVAGVMLLEYAERRGLKRATLIALPVVGVLLYSLSIGMLQKAPLNASWNISIWPIGLLIGLPIAAYALLKRDRVAALGAAPFCTPYLMITSWAAVLPMCFKSRTAQRWSTVAAIAVMLLIFFVLRVPDILRGML